PEYWARAAMIIQFAGFNLTFFPQFILGYLGMPRRYASYPPEFQTLHVLSTAGASILGLGLGITIFYLLWSLKNSPRAVANPWGAPGLEWRTSSPPPTENFHVTPVVTWEAYEFAPIETMEVLGYPGDPSRPTQPVSAEHGTED
ncbi:MAG TPA: cbb3-type cytochrome c oxidase subunit I, partial [Candidatus Kapabacteria bacterium]|nr:cbb3-type cytochrome c oxidase subunit I [Candidatus Kapabacteria bacterium]